MKKSQKNNKLNKFVLYVSSIAIALFVLAYSVGEVKAESVVGYETVGNPNKSKSTSYGFAGESFIASTTNITGLDVMSGANWNGYLDLSLVICKNPNTSDRYSPCSENDIIYSEDFLDVYIPFDYEYFNLTFSDLVLLDIGSTYGFAVRDSNYNSFYVRGYDTDVFSDGLPLGKLLSDSYFKDLAFRLYFDNSFSAPNNYILYYGDVPYYQEINKPAHLPFSYDICDTWSASSTYSVRLVDDEDNDILENNKILSSCGGIDFVYPFVSSSDFSEYVRIIIFDDFDNIIVESEEFLFNIYTPVLDENSFIFYTLDNPLYINTDLGTGTEPIAFSYNVCSDSDFASSTFILKDVSNNIETEYTFIPTECYGNTYINAPYNQYMNLTFPAQIIYKNDDKVLLESSVFQLVFYSDELTDTSDLDDETATSTNIILNFATTQLNKLKNLFPFNFPVAIMTAWNNSKTETLNSDLAFLDMSDSEGSLTATFPKEWALTDEDLEFDFFSEDMITQGSSSAQDFFSSFKEFTKWLQYFLFAWGFIIFSKKIINDLTENKSDDI